MFRAVFFLVTTYLIGYSPINSQLDSIPLINSSFEDDPARVEYVFELEGWEDCGQMYFRAESPPDIHQDNNAWSNNIKPIDGKTYLGMVVRDNDTWEAISQKLVRPIISNSIYQFSIALMQSDSKVSVSRLYPDKTVNFQKPAVLRIWGGDAYCRPSELLAISPPIDNRSWQKYIFTLEPQESHHFIILEAMYDDTESLPYNGHILLDMASHLQIITDK